MIDTAAEKLVTFADASRMFPGRSVCVATVTRWALKGCVRGMNGRKVVLDSVIIGGYRMTSAEAIHRFVSDQNGGSQVAIPTEKTLARRSKNVDLALAARGGELKKKGEERTTGSP